MAADTGKEGRGEASGPAGSKVEKTVANANKRSSGEVAGQQPKPDSETKKKKRRYSRGLRDVQTLERGATRSVERLARAVFRGLARYDRLREKSSRKKRDGAIRDGLDNWSRAIGRGLRVASNTPYDFIKEINTKRFSRRLRDTVRTFVPPMFR